jgi:cellulose synthase (UDP-forming)
VGKIIRDAENRVSGTATYNTGRLTISISLRDRIVFALLVFLGCETVLYYADYWFLGGHRKNIVLFILLSYVVFRGIVRSVFSWIFFQFVSIPRQSPMSEKLSVDVMITAMPGEPYEMFKETLSAVSAITYPHTGYLLDGGNDLQLKALCAETGMTHVNCSGVQGAKAGKINYCLKEHAKGEVVLILDCDHVPCPDVLDKILPCFSDKKVGFVQMVQAYYNADKNNVTRAAAEQSFGFYGPLQMGLDGLSMPIAIGANCTFRRAALDSIGGHAVHLAEDACTSMRIHAAGWKSRYVPYRGSYGIVPEDVQTFFKQQIKWAKGMFDLFFREYPRLFKNLNVQNKFYYFFAGTFYLTGIVSSLSILLPIVFLFMQIYAIEMPIDGFFLHVIPYLIMSNIITWYIQRWYSDSTERQVPWRSMVMEKGTWYIYTLAFFYSLLGKNVPYVPTPKSGTQRTDFVLLLPHILAVCLSVAAVVYPFLVYHRIDDGTKLMMFFASANIVTLLPVIFWGRGWLLGGKKSKTAGDFIDLHQEQRGSL